MQSPIAFKTLIDAIDANSCMTMAESQALANQFVVNGGTGEGLLASLSEGKGVSLELLFADHHLPVLGLVPDYSDFAKPAVFCAVANGAHRLLTLLLQRGADPYIKSEDGIPPIVAAAIAGGVRGRACSERLLRAGVSIDTASDDGMTALMRAAAEGHADFVRHLLEAGANVERSDRRGCTALHWAVGYGASELGKKTHLPKGCLEVVRLLLEAGAAADARDFKRRTPLHHLARTRQGFEAHDAAAAIALLVRHGADIDARDEQARTPLMTAAANGTDGVFLVGLLHRAGASMDARSRGVTIEEMAASEEVLRAIRSIRMGETIDSAMTGGGAPAPAPSGGFTL